MVVTSSSSISFGLLDVIVDRTIFIAASVGVRVLEALGCAAFKTGCFAFVAKEFPDNVATAFATLETFFGLGLISGPTVGGALFQLWGYKGPFFVLGSVLMTTALVSVLALPMEAGDREEEEEERDKEKRSLLEVLQVPLVSVGAVSIVCASMGLGILIVGLEAHVRHYDLSPILVGKSLPYQQQLFSLCS